MIFLDDKGAKYAKTEPDNKGENMPFSSVLKESLSSLHLLDHPFYQDWNEGKLSKERLKHYAGQYFWHVDSFPRYISATHSLCENIDDRRILLENLADEEGLTQTHHPELWLRFAEGLGQSRDTVLSGEKSDAIQNVIDTFFELSRSSYVEGLAALYAYEYQVPEVAKTKIEGLVKNYGIDDKNTLSFFKVHQEADVYHREACEKLLNNLSDEDQAKATAAAKRAGQALWDFLTAMHEVPLNEAAA